MRRALAARELLPRDRGLAGNVNNKMLISLMLDLVKCSRDFPKKVICLIYKNRDLGIAEKTFI